MSSVWSTNAAYKAENCIDGSIQGSSCVSKKTKCPWIALKLSTLTPIKKVVIHNTASTEHTPNINVIVSNQLPVHEDVKFTQGNFFGRFEGPAAAGEKIEITASSAKTGRYVVVQMLPCQYPDIPLKFREVTVFGPGTLARKKREL